MADLLQTGFASSVIFFGATVLGYVTSRKVGRLGYATWALGYLVGVLRVVVSFVELPLAIVWTVVIVYLAVAIPAVTQSARRARRERREALAKQPRITG